MSLAAYRAAGGTIITMEATFSGSYANFSLAGRGAAIIDWGDDAPLQTFDLNELPDNRWMDWVSENKYIIYHKITCKTVRKITIAGNITGICTGKDLHISTLDTGNMPQLIALLCYNVGLSALDVSKNTKLQTLHIHGNALTALDISKNLMLRYLDCRNNRIEHAELVEILIALPDRFYFDHIEIVCGGNPGYKALTAVEKSFADRKYWAVLEALD